MPDAASIKMNDRLGRVLLRYFRKGDTANVAEPAFQRRADDDLLKLHWAFSSPLLRLAQYVIENAHEVQASLAHRERIDDAVIRGRLLPSKTVIKRLTTGHPSLVVCAEPVRSYSEGPNHVLIWVLQAAYRTLVRFEEFTKKRSSYATRIIEGRILLGRVKRIGVLEAAISSTDERRVPSPNALRQAASSRKSLYRMAFAAYDNLKKIERGDKDAINDVLHDTLIGPLKEWQRFELLLALVMAEELARQSKNDVRLLPMFAGLKKPIAQVGKFDIFWQIKTDHYVPPALEPSEQIVEDVLDSYGIDKGTDRPDVVVVDRDAGTVCSVAEAKFYERLDDDRAFKAIRDAVTQVVRYSRGYRSTENDVRNFLPKCLVAVAASPAEGVITTAPTNAPVIVDLRQLLEGTLNGWAERFN